MWSWVYWIKHFVHPWKKYFREVCYFYLNIDLEELDELCDSDSNDSSDSSDNDSSDSSDNDSSDSSDSVSSEIENNKKTTGRRVDSITRVVSIKFVNDVIAQSIQSISVIVNDDWVVVYDTDFSR